MKKLATIGTFCLFCLGTSAANAIILTWELVDPDSGTSASFVFEEGIVDGLLTSSELAPITGDFGDGVFAYQFNSTSSTNGTSYDVSDLSLISWTFRGSLLSTNSSTSGALRERAKLEGVCCPRE